MWINDPSIHLTNHWLKGRNETTFAPAVIASDVCVRLTTKKRVQSQKKRLRSTESGLHWPVAMWKAWRRYVLIWSRVPKKRSWRWRVQYDFQLSTWKSPPERHHVVKGPKPGIGMRWGSIRGWLIFIVPLRLSSRLHPSALSLALKLKWLLLTLKWDVKESIKQ